MKKPIIVLLVILLLAAGTAIGYLFTDNYKARNVNTFEDCVAAGFPVMESYPPQCNAGTKHFVDKLTVPPLAPPPATQQNPNITVNSPLPNTQVSSPLTITGQAVGPWYFEASFPVKLYDANNTLLVSAPAQAQSDWMTTNFVPFSVTLTFPTPSTTTGTLVLEKDNPSGEPQNADSISIPVIF